mgnify:FL=1
MEDELQKEKKAWRDKMMQHEVKLYSDLFSKDYEVTVILENICYSITANTPIAVY